MKKIFSSIKNKFSNKNTQVLLFFVALYIYLLVYHQTTSEPNFYSQINVYRQSSYKTLRKEYRVFQKKFHPDRNTMDQDFYMHIKEIYDILLDKKKRELYDTFNITIKQNQQIEPEVLIIQNLVRFLQDSFISLIFIVLIGFSGGKKGFGQILMFYLAIIAINCYLNFIKQAQFDIFDIIFPHMTSFEIKQVIQNNFLLLSFFFDYIDDYFFESKQLQQINNLKKMKEQLKDFTKRNK